MDQRSLLESNRKWREEIIGKDPGYFQRLAKGQQPPFLYIGCADSRVSPARMLGTQPGDAFVVRNVANLVRPDDLAIQTVLAYGLGVLRIPHVIVCGHTGCGGVQAALDGVKDEPLVSWLDGVAKLARSHGDELNGIADPAERAERLVELNVREQVRRLNESEAMARARTEWGGPQVHAWVFELHSGAIRELSPD
ncbi:MAG: carbonic anhydrase [Myxococcota bacterium]